MSYHDFLQSRPELVEVVMDSAYSLALSSAENYALWGVYPESSTVALATASWKIKDIGMHTIMGAFYTSSASAGNGCRPEPYVFPQPILLRGLIGSTQGVRLWVLISEKFVNPR